MVLVDASHGIRIDYPYIRVADSLDQFRYGIAEVI